MVAVSDKILISVKSKDGRVTQLRVPAYLARVPHLLEDIKAGRVGDAPFKFTAASDAAFAGVKLEASGSARFQSAHAPLASSSSPQSRDFDALSALRLEWFQCGSARVIAQWSDRDTIREGVADATGVNHL